MKRLRSQAPAPSRARGLSLPGESRLIAPCSRRGFLQVTAGAAAALSLGVLPGCAEDPDEVFNPDNVLLLWLAQTMSGRITSGVDRAPVAGATVTFQATINPGLYITQGTAVTNSQGSYFMDAKDSPGGGGEPGAFWRFAVPESREYIVYLRVLAGKSGVGSGVAERTVTRTPSREIPRGGLGGFQLTQDVVLAPI